MRKDDYVYFMYGLQDALVEEIFKSGITSNIGRTLTPYNQDFVKKIYADFVDEAELDKNIKNFAQNYNFVFYIKIPRSFMFEERHIDGFRPVVPFWRENDDGTNTLVPSLIAGCYIKQTGKYVNNEQYNILFNPNGLKFSDEQIINMSFHGQYREYWKARHRNEKSTKELLEADIKNKRWKETLEEYEFRLKYAERI